MEQKVKDRNVDEAKLTIILIALGVSRDRADQLNGNDKKKKILKWIKSILNYTSCEMTEKYQFPYSDILNAKEIENELRDRVGVTAIETSTVPGPFGKPKNVKERVESLQYLDGHPEEFTPQQDRETSDLRDAIISGAIKKAFLKPLEGNDKNATRLGHQNEPKYTEQLYQDSQKGLVPGVKLIDVMACGLAMMVDKPYVRSSADAIAIEEKRWAELNYIDEEDELKSHPVECKCRSGLGYDGSLAKSKHIAKLIAGLGGPGASARQAMGKAVYHKVSSNERELMTKLVPDGSERIQILHHAYTYGAKQTTFLVGDPRGKILYGLVVTFEESLLENYGKALDYLYENGLKTIYEDKIEDLPLNYIESILLGDEILKQKYTLDDFMFSLLIWRKINPINSNLSAPKYPIPPCNMLVPLDCSLWNSSKGGSDTVTRYAWNCQIIVPVRSPQTVIVARFFSLYSVLFHRLIQSVTMAKKPDVEEDTIKHIRDRNNKRWPFHISLGKASKRLLQKSKSFVVQGAEQNSNNGDTEYLQQKAVRLTNQNERQRFDINHSIMGPVGTTSATPLGRGARKELKNQGSAYEAYKRRCVECVVGTPIRLVRQMPNQSFELDKRNCDLCGHRGVTWMCRDCKMILCFDSDRTKLLREKLRSDEGDKIRSMAPEFESLQRGNAPAHYIQMGELKGNMAYTTMSCFHYCHPEYFNGNDDRKSEAETRDDPLSALVSSNSRSPLAG